LHLTRLKATAKSCSLSTNFGKKTHMY